MKEIVNQVWNASPSAIMTTVNNIELIAFFVFMFWIIFMIVIIFIINKRSKAFKKKHFSDPFFNQ